MILKLLIFAFIGIMIYKFLGGQLPTIGKERPKSDGKRGQSDMDEDTMVECSTCGTFVTLKESIIIHGKYYCSRECIPK